MGTSRPVDDVVEQFLAEKLDIIKQEFAPLQIILFGSRAEGRATEESDIDIILISDRFEGIRWPNRMGQFLNRVHPHVHVDALCYTPDEFENMLKAPMPFARDAVAHGIRIV